MKAARRWWGGGGVSEKLTKVDMGGWGGPFQSLKLYQP